MDAMDVIGQARDAITVRRVYGDPYQEEGVTVIPAAHVMGGAGGGTGAEGSGTGFGLRAPPAGAWIIKDGEATWKPAIDVNRIVFMAQIVAIVFLLTVRSMARSAAKR